MRSHNTCNMTTSMLQHRNAHSNTKHHVETNGIFECVHGHYSFCTLLCNVKKLMEVNLETQECLAHAVKFILGMKRLRTDTPMCTPKHCHNSPKNLLTIIISTIKPQTSLTHPSTAKERTIGYLTMRRQQLITGRFQTTGLLLNTLSQQ